MNILRSSAALVAAGALALSLAGPASASPDDTSAGWTSRQLTNGVVVFPQYGDYADYGMTTDAALALKAIGGHAADLDTIGAALAENADTWTAPSGVVNAGSTAKAVVAAQATGSDPRSFGGVDLVDRLEGRVSTVSPIVGRIEDDGPNDYTNVYSQAFAARGLARAGSDRADDALSFLLKQQCKAGYFRLYFNADKTDAHQGCVAGDAETSAPDTDATAAVVLSLKALPTSARSDAVTAAQRAALAWLKRTQKDNGSFGGGPTTKASNSDSTGLAGWALGATGSCSRAKQAATWVKALQVRGDVSGTPLQGQKGAIAYNRKAFDKAQDAGITDGAQYQWRKATFDAAPSLRYLSCG